MSITSRHSADAVVIGGGFAGAASAYFLSCSGLKVFLLEQEDLPGRHASGRNAAVARHFVANPDHLPLAVEGMRFMEEPPDGFPRGPYFRRTGSMMLAGPEQEAPLRASVAAAQRAGLNGAWLSAEEVERIVPATVGGTFVGAAYGHDDGVVDIAALLDGYLRAARARGLEVLAGERLVAVDTAGDAITGIRTESTSISTPFVVNAAGAWASAVARLAGATPLPLKSFRRHLVVSGPVEGVDPRWPAVWDLSHEVYFRPEPPGLLLSPCDATESEPGSEAVDGEALEQLAEKLVRWFPKLSGLSIASAFAGQRTFTPDGNLLLGRDPWLRGFFWCAGLGGNGMTLSPAIGRLTAEAVLGQPPPPVHDARRYEEP